MGVAEARKTKWKLSEQTEMKAEIQINRYTDIKKSQKIGKGLAD